MSLYITGKVLKDPLYAIVEKYNEEFPDLKLTLSSCEEHDDYLLLNYDGKQIPIPKYDRGNFNDYANHIRYKFQIGVRSDLPMIKFGRKPNEAKEKHRLRKDLDKLLNSDALEYAVYRMKRNIGIAEALCGGKLTPAIKLCTEYIKLQQLEEMKNNIDNLDSKGLKGAISLVKFCTSFFDED